jgi:hypothetical protein
MFNDKKMLINIKRMLVAHEFTGGYILSLTTSPKRITLQLQLPPQKEIADLDLLLNNLKEELKANDVRIVQRIGKRVTIEFGTHDLTNIDFDNKFLHPNTLKVELPSSFGSETIDFEDGASCHMLNGGAPRMGKTLFLCYIYPLSYTTKTKGILSYTSHPPKEKTSIL